MKYFGTTIGNPSKPITKSNGNQFCLVQCETIMKKKMVNITATVDYELSKSLQLGDAIDIHHTAVESLMPEIGVVHLFQIVRIHN